MPGAQHIDIEDAPEQVVGDRLQIGMGDDFGETGIVDHHVESPVALHGGRHQGPGLIVIADIGLYVDGIGKRRRHRRPVGHRRNRIDHHLCALGGKQPSSGFADAAGRTGDECHFAAELSHAPRIATDS